MYVDELHKVCEMLLWLIIHSPHTIKLKLNRMIISVSKMKRLVSTSLVIMIITAVVGHANFDISQSQQITPEQRTQMCDPNNPKLNFVNSTD